VWPETDEQVKVLADVSVGMMFDVIEPLAEVLTTMPVGPENPGRTAGPSFELFYQPDYLLPHRRAAWLLMAEHLGEAAALVEAETCGQWRPVAIRTVSTRLAARTATSTAIASGRDRGRIRGDAVVGDSGPTGRSPTTTRRR
jgi:hypothetical protein